jgi:hypothetical protein
MDAQTKAQLQEHVDAIAAILHAEANPQALKTFEGIETSIRTLTQEHVLPQLAVFLLKQRLEQQQANVGPSAASSVMFPSPASKLNA